VSTAWQPFMAVIMRTRVCCARKQLRLNSMDAAGHDEEGAASQGPAPPASPGPSSGRAPLRVLRFQPAALADFSILTADGVELRVHRAILAQKSQLFAALFEDVGCSTSSLQVQDSWGELRPLLANLYPQQPCWEEEAGVLSGPASPAGSADDAGTTSASWQPAVTVGKLHWRSGASMTAPHCCLFVTA